MLPADHERGESGSEESAGRFHEAVRQAPMAAWNIVLGDFNQPNDPYQQHKDAKAVLRVAEIERGSDHGKGRKPFQIGRSRRNRPELDRREGENRNGTDEQPCDPAEENLGFHSERFS